MNLASYTNHSKPKRNLRINQIGNYIKKTPKFLALSAAAERINGKWQFPLLNYIACKNKKPARVA